MHKYRAYLLSTLRHITVSLFIYVLGIQTGTQHLLSHLLSINGTTKRTKLDTSTWKVPKISSWLMNSLIKQEALIYSLELTNSTIYFDQAEGHVFSITKFYKRQFLAGLPQVELQPPLHSITLGLHFCTDRQNSGA